MRFKSVAAAAAAALLTAGAFPATPPGAPVRASETEQDPRVLRARKTLDALSKALEDRNADAFLALIHDDAVYALHHRGFAPARGHDEIRIAFGQLMTAFPDIRFETLGAQIKPGLAVSYWRMTGTLAAPWPLGDRVAIPDGSERPVSVEGVDIFTFADDGRILRKDAFVDVSPWFEAYGRRARAPDAADPLPPPGTNGLD